MNYNLQALGVDTVATTAAVAFAGGAGVLAIGMAFWAGHFVTILSVGFGLFGGGMATGLILTHLLICKRNYDKEVRDKDQEGSTTNANHGKISQSYFWKMLRLSKDD